MPEYVHGGDVYSMEPTAACARPVRQHQPLRHPRGEAGDAGAVEDCTRYPDPFCRAARRAIGAAEGVDPDWLYCGNGAADVLDRLAAVLRPKTALLTAPTFAEYERTLGGADIRFHLLREDEGFAVTERILSDITPEIDAVYLCNPNNPTGRTIDPPLLHRIAEKCAQTGAGSSWTSASRFLTDGAQRTLKPCSRLPKLVLLRAYTKMYAVPGVRFGWCMTSDAGLIEGLYRAGQPWNVSVIAQACAAAAAGERAYAAQTAQRIAAERAHLAAALSRRGMTVYPGEANFLLFRTADPALRDKLAARGVLIRDCSNYRGLGAGYYRTAVKTGDETARLAAALDAIQEES